MDLNDEIASSKKANAIKLRKNINTLKRSYRRCKKINIDMRNIEGEYDQTYMLSESEELSKEVFDEQSQKNIHEQEKTYYSINSVRKNVIFLKK